VPVYESKAFIKKTGSDRRGWAVKMLGGRAFIHFPFHGLYTDVELIMYTFSIINKVGVHSA
jgi:hypothetical protein